MGLDLYTANHHFQAVSYRSVHQVRAKCIDATVSLFRKTGRDDAANRIASLRNDQISTGIDYAEIDPHGGAALSFDIIDAADPAFDELTIVLAGLRKWVDHSDCEGHLTPGDAADVAFMLWRIRPYWPGDGPAFGSDYLAELTEFFEKAADDAELIRFG